MLERPFAHLFETGGMRRVHRRGHPNILKRLLVHVAGCNLGLLLRHLIGVGTPRSLQGRAVAQSRKLDRNPFGTAAMPSSLISWLGVASESSFPREFGEYGEDVGDHDSL